MRPAMMYALEMMALTKTQDVGLEVAEMRMLSSSLEVSRMDSLRNERDSSKLERHA